MVFRCPPEFIFLYREFGGNLWIKDSKGQTADEITDDAPALKFLKLFQGKKIVVIFFFEIILNFYRKSPFPSKLVPPVDKTSGWSGQTGGASVPGNSSKTKIISEIHGFLC